MALFLSWEQKSNKINGLKLLEESLIEHNISNATGCYAADAPFDAYSGKK
jgi:hypothetical protein